MDEQQALNELYSSSEPPHPSVVQRQREKLMTTIETTKTRDAQLPRRSRRRIIGLIGAPVAAMALAAAGSVVLRDEPRDVAAIRCVANGASALLPNDGTPPIDACRAQWEAGNMHEGVTTAPPLTACINSGASIEIIVAKTPGACEVAGMTPWTGKAAYESVGAAVRAVRVSFHDRYQATGNGCATEEDWNNALHRELGAEAWTIVSDQVRPDRHCFDAASLDPATQTVTLIGVPGDYSIGCDPRTGC